MLSIWVHVLGEGDSPPTQQSEPDKTLLDPSVASQDPQPRFAAKSSKDRKNEILRTEKGSYLGKE